MRSKNKIEIKEFSYFSHDTDRLRLVGKKFPKILIANPEDGRKSPRAVSGICLSRPPLRRIDVSRVADLPPRPPPPDWEPRAPPTTQTKHK